MRLLQLILLVAFGDQENKKLYNDHMVVRTGKLNQNQVKYLQKLEAEGPHDFWKPPMIDGSADIMVERELLGQLTQELDEANISHSTTIHNVQK